MQVVQSYCASLGDAIRRLFFFCLRLGLGLFLSDTPPDSSLPQSATSGLPLKVSASLSSSCTLSIFYGYTLYLRAEAPLLLPCLLFRSPSSSLYVATSVIVSSGILVVIASYLASSAISLDCRFFYSVFFFFLFKSLSVWLLSPDHTPTKPRMSASASRQLLLFPV